MNADLLIPLSFLALPVFVTALIAAARVHDLEIETHRRLDLEKVQHHRRMKDLESQLQRIRSRQ